VNTVADAFHVKRLGELVEAYGIAPRGRHALATLLDLLAADPNAPTTVTDPDRGVDVHLADSLVALEIDAVRQATVLADLGAGAGIPGLPLAAALPDAHVVLVESVGRKGAFMERCIAAMGLANAEVVTGRAEDWRDGIGTCDVVTARALAPLNVLLEYAAPLLRDGGVLVAWKGHRDADEERDGHAAALQLGMEVEEVGEVAPFAAAEARHLVVARKIAPTPSGFPRRAGMARKRPLH
jgi:16S rRNA (guanine527-N7)-methyltransferase